MPSPPKEIQIVAFMANSAGLKKEKEAKFTQGATDF